MGPTRISVCGPLSVTIDGEAREGALRGRQGRMLLAYLVLNRHRAVRRDELADVLWAESGTPEGGEALLAPPLSRLRRALGDGRLVACDAVLVGVGAVANDDAVAAGAQRQRAGTVAGRDRVAAVAHGDLVVALAQRQLVVAVANRDRVYGADAVGGGHNVVAVSQRQRICARAGSVEAIKRMPIIALCTCVFSVLGARLNSTTPAMFRASARLRHVSPLGATACRRGATRRPRARRDPPADAAADAPSCLYRRGGCGGDRASPGKRAAATRACCVAGGRSPGLIAALIPGAGSSVAGSG